ncbi:hypothetical protein [Tamlana sp. I1]|uniref:hypothetical protein n=1 Tax=Tamlana sp. I1 TaxID=2762061 RepID=UPI00188E0219|nr:hypothetical protein [Tamlana sp. I1]
MSTSVKKKLIIDWISSIDDKEIIEQIFEYRKLKTKSFNENMKHAITADEVREETDFYIKSLDWKK